LRKQEIEGNRVEFLVLRRVEDDSRILVPVDKATQVGLRDVIGRAEAAQIRKILRTRTGLTPRGGGPWSRRFRDYQEKLRRGSIFDMAEVLGDLLRLQIEKELSFGEQRMLDSAWTRVVHEIAAAENSPPEKIETELREIRAAHRPTESAPAP
jgi:CarD family transcriptional regulator